MDLSCFNVGFSSLNKSVSAIFHFFQLFCYPYSLWKKKRSYYFWFQNLRANRQCSHGFTFRICFWRISFWSNLKLLPSIELLPDLTECLKHWKRYVNDTVCFSKVGTTKFIISVPNSFDKNIQFTFEKKKHSLVKKKNNITATVYKKTTSNDIYLNWNALAPDTWK